MHLSTAMLSIFLQLVKKVFLLGANFLHILMMPELDLSLFFPPKLTLFFIPSFVLAVSLAGKCVLNTFAMMVQGTISPSYSSAVTKWQLVGGSINFYKQGFYCWNFAWMLGSKQSKTISAFSKKIKPNYVLSAVKV